MEKRHYRLMKYILLLIFITTSLIFFWFKEGLLIGNAESGLPFYNLKKQVEISSRAWTDTNLGNNTALLVGVTPAYWVLSLLENINIPPFLIQALFFWFILTVSALSIFFLTKELFPEIENKIAILASIFYLFNLFSLANIWTRFLTNHMVASAAIPLLFYLYLLAIRKEKLSYGVLTGFTSVLFSFALTSNSIIIILWSLFGFTTLFYIVTGKSIEKSFFYIKVFLLTLIIFFVVNLWWISQLLELMLVKTSLGAVGNFLSQGNLDTLSIESQLLGSFINTLRFMHGTFFVQGQEWARFFTFKPIMLLEFLLTLVIFICILIYRKQKEVLLLGLLFLTGLFLVKGNNLPFGGIFEFLFVKIPIVQVFRNPFEKLGFVLILTGSLLFAKGINGIFEYIGRTSVNRILYYIIFIFLLFVWGRPFWSSEALSSNENIPKEQVKDYKVKVPDYYKEANEFFNDQEGSFRFVSLPIRGEGISYNWEKPYIGVDLSFTFFDTPNISNNTTIPFYSELVLSLSNYQLNPKVVNFFPFIDAKYILLREDLNYLRDHMANPKVLNSKLEQMVDNGVLSKKANFGGKLSIYEIDEKWFWPKIYITPKIAVSNKSYELNDIDRLDPSFPEQMIGIIDSGSLTEGENRFSNRIVKPETVFFPYFVNLEQDLRDEDVLSRLPNINSLPGQSGYSLSKTKDELEVPFSGVNYWDQIVYKISLLGKRAVEIFKMQRLQFSPSVIKHAEISYKEEIDRLSLILIQRSKIGVQIPNTIQENLLLQYLLAKRVGSSIKEPLKELLLNLDVVPKFELPHSDDQKYIVYRFNMPFEDYYYLNLDNFSSDINLFLDGQEIPKKDNGEFKMRLDKGQHELSARLDLTSQRMFLSEDYADLSPTLPFRKDIEFEDLTQIYKIDFDYKLNSGDRLGVFVIDDTNQVSPTYFTPSRNDWNHVSIQYNSNFGATSAQLQIQSNGEAQVRNFKIIKVEKPNPIFTSSAFSLNETSDTTWDFVKINPAHYLIKVKKNSTKEELLVFSELFDSKWKIYGKDKEFENNHFLVNGYANGWVIDKSGDYYLELKFSPQKTLEITGILAIVSFVLIGCTFLLLELKKRKKI